HRPRRPAALPGVVPRARGLPRAVRGAGVRGPGAALPAGMALGGGALHPPRRARHQSLAGHAGHAAAAGGARPAPVAAPGRDISLTEPVLTLGRHAPQEARMSNPRNPNDPDSLSLKGGGASSGDARPDFSNVRSGASSTEAPAAAPDFSNVQSSARSTEELAGTTEYTVQKGDTLSHIARALRQGQRMAAHLRRQPRPAGRSRPDPARPGPEDPGRG